MTSLSHFTCQEPQNSLQTRNTFESNNLTKVPINLPISFFPSSLRKRNAIRRQAFFVIVWLLVFNPCKSPKQKRDWWKLERFVVSQKCIFVVTVNLMNCVTRASFFMYSSTSKLSVIKFSLLFNVMLIKWLCYGVHCYVFMAFLLDFSLWIGGFVWCLECI